MAGRVSPYVDNTGLVFGCDLANTVRSYKGEPTTNFVPGTYPYSLYAYASGPVDTPTVNEKGQSITAKRYTITNAVNTARAMILPTDLVTGIGYTFSFKWKYNGTTTTTPSVGISAAKGYPEGGANNNSFTSQVGDTVDIGNGWYLSTYTFVFSACPTGKSMLTFGISTGSTSSYVGETFDVYEAQFETKSHRTPFASGTRSGTQGLIDLAGKSIININGASFDSNAQMTFDGTNDYVYVANAIGDMPLASGASEYTIEALFKANSTKTQVIWEQNSSGVTQHQRACMILLSTGYGGFNGQSNDFHSAVPYSTGVWYHWTITVQKNAGSNPIKVYVNGVLTAQGDSSAGASNLNVGTYGCAMGFKLNANGEYFDGDIKLVRVYNRVLGANEVASNFKGVKSRFNI